jgi:hypothetical protein
MFGRGARTIAVAAAMAFGATSAAQAGIGDGLLGAREPLINTTQVEKAQFIFGGQNYCWYDNGWRGPGWYWCGYAFRSGLGWGGGVGWHGWRRGGGGGWRGGGMHGGGHFGGGHFGGGHGGAHFGGGHMGGGHGGGGHRGGGGARRH